MKKIKCNCGKLVYKIRRINGKIVCDNCQQSNLSGKWERNNAQERQFYARDILQPSDPNFEKVYGKK